MSNSGDASVGTGNTAAGDQRAEPDSTNDPVSGLLQPIVDLLAPPSSSGSANTDIAPPTAGGGASSTAAAPATTTTNPGVTTNPAVAAEPGVATKPAVVPSGSATQPNQPTSAGGAAISGDGANGGGITMFCSVSNSYADPGVLGVLAHQYQSGPVQTMTCVPAAVGHDGGVTVLSACTVSNGYTNPGVLDLLAPQYQSGPAQTMTCVPAAVRGDTGGGGVTVMSACAVSNTYTNPGVLGVLAPQFQSGPVQTVTCVPAAVVAHDETGSVPEGPVTIGGPSIKPAPTASSNEATSTGPGRAFDRSATSLSHPGSMNTRSPLPRTGFAQSLITLRNLAGLLLALGVLAMTVGRGTTKGHSLPATERSSRSVGSARAGG